MLGVGEGKCRLLRLSGVAVGFQSDVFFSDYRTQAEHRQNKPSHCKTIYLRPAGAFGPRHSGQQKAVSG